MKQLIKSYWVFLLIQALIYLILGIAAFFMPVQSLSFIKNLLIIYLVIRGIVEVLNSLFSRLNSHRFSTFFSGALHLAFAYFIFAWPEITLASIVFIMATWLLIWGSILVILGFSIPFGKTGKLIMMFIGFVTILIGTWSFFNIPSAMKAAIMFAGVILLINSVVYFFLAFVFKRAENDFEVIDAEYIEV